MPREVYTLADLRDWPSATVGAQPPLRLAVVGDPVAHSASPPMHDAALEAEGISARYTRLHIRAEELAEALPLIAGQGFIGANLTIPHKTNVLPLLDSLDDHAALLGAVNTVRVETDGTLRGYNTDGPGFVRATRAEFDCGLGGLHVIILGAGGGAGRALAIQCILEGCVSLVLFNRTMEKADALAAELRSRFADRDCTIAALPWKFAAAQKTLEWADIVINASALGLKPGDPSPFDPQVIPSRLKVFDTVYRRDGQATALLAAARAAGAQTADGFALLLHQGALAFERWFERPAPLEVMRAALENPSGTPG